MLRVALDAVNARAASSIRFPAWHARSKRSPVYRRQPYCPRRVPRVPISPTGRDEVSGPPNSEDTRMGLLTFSLNVTLDGCVDHQEGIADAETHAFFTRLMDEGGAMLWGRTTYEMMESYWPAVARGEVEAPPTVREWAVKLEVKPKYVASSTRKDFPWTNSHHIAGDLRTGVQKLKDATPAGVLLGSG